MQTNIITGAAVNIEFRWTPAVLDAKTGRVGASCVPFGADNAFELFVSWTTDAENPCFRWSITDADGRERRTDDPNSGYRGREDSARHHQFLTKQKQ